MNRVLFCLKLLYLADTPDELRDRGGLGDGYQGHLAAVARDDLPAGYLLFRVIAPPPFLAIMNNLDIKKSS